jgi:hypothetical protein
MMRAFLMLVLFTNLFCAAEANHQWLATELQTYLPKGVAAVVENPGEKYELVKIRWEKPIVVHHFINNAPPNDADDCSHVHDPISIRISPDKSLGEVYAHKSKYFTVLSSIIEWKSKLKDMPGVRIDDWRIPSGPAEWLNWAKPSTADEKQILADYKLFFTNEYEPVMARSRVCPNFIFKGQFIRLESILDSAGTIEPNDITTIQNTLKIIESRCEGWIAKY